MSHNPVRLVVADDHPVVLRGLISLLDSKRPFSIVASCSNGTEGISIIRKLRPHVALLDTSMPGPSCLEILEIVRAEDLPTRIVLLSASMADRDLAAAAVRGVHGVLFKDCSPDALLHGLHEVASGRKWLPTRLFNGPLQHETRRENRAAFFGALTDREYEVMLLVSTGLTNKQIARQLSICEGTVKLHLHSIYGKAAVSNRTALAALARSNCDVFYELRGLGFKVQDHLAILGAARSNAATERVPGYDPGYCNGHAFVPSRDEKLLLRPPFAGRSGTAAGAR
jgi:DNA-binding NarL/FixJ family response regulator